MSLCLFVKFVYENAPQKRYKHLHLFSHHSSRENYLFVCLCPKCMAQMDDADVTSEDEDEGEGETEGDEMEDEMTDV